MDRGEGVCLPSSHHIGDGNHHHPGLRLRSLQQRPDHPAQAGEGRHQHKDTHNERQRHGSSFLHGWVIGLWKDPSRAANRSPRTSRHRNGPAHNHLFRNDDRRRPGRCVDGYPLPSQPRLQVVKKRVSLLVAAVGVLGEGAKHDGVQLRRNLGIVGGRGRDFGGDMLVGHGHGGLALKGRTAHQHLVQDHPQRIDVGSSIGRATLGLLRAEICGRADYGTGSRKVC